MRNRGLTIKQKGKRIKVESLKYNEDLAFQQSLEDMEYEEYKYLQFINHNK